MAFCPTCGASVPDGAAFYSRCGASLTTAIPPPTAASSPLPGPPPLTYSAPSPTSFAQPVAVAQTGQAQHNGKATASMVLGLVGLVVCLVPVLGLAVSIVGIALGSIGLKSERHGHATAGLVLSILDLIGSIAWAVIGGLASLGAFL